jgi:hypothetical protein
MLSEKMTEEEKAYLGLAMQERSLFLNSCYVIPFREKLSIYLRRFFVGSYLFLRYKMRKFIKTDMANPADVIYKYVKDYEAPRLLEILGIKEKDATAAVKVATYMHNLTHPLGEITEMTPHRSVRIERYCPYAQSLSRERCRDIFSGPAFRGLCEAINPDLAHKHTSYLSGGDECCDIIFEMRQ